MRAKATGWKQKSARKSTVVEQQAKYVKAKSVGKNVAMAASLQVLQ